MKNFKNRFSILLLSVILVYSSSCTGGADDRSNGSLVNNKRQGIWDIKNDNGVIIASGNYNNGLKEGLWQYAGNNYNNKNEIDWNILKYDWGTLNIPAEWVLHKDSLAVLDARYNNLSLNVIILDSEEKKLNSIAFEVESLNKSKVSYELIEKSFVSINNFPAFLLRQKMELPNGINYCEQFGVYNKKDQSIFLLSFFNNRGYSYEAHKVFSEIAFSVQLF